jgi:hypothetical protein
MSNVSVSASHWTALSLADPTNCLRRGLMQREEWKNLGMADIQKTDGACASCSADVEASNRTKS